MDENSTQTNIPETEARGAPFQERVQSWVLDCFGSDIAGDRAERNRRFLEESLELVQALGFTRDSAHQLVEYVFNRPKGEPEQELGGVMVTLASLCETNGLDMAAEGEAELARINSPDVLVKIRARNAAKPAF
ncbi:hypothetical protein [Pararhodospirillum oryzae]|uniref:Uncharacterized protein n=1 Tax=Pararhodospirillum oryzae TaxID=478448 RepID=A0A512HBU9_9PROT|nr:hypothetical protein [Pararhodospirillum oryzae]GEO82923.1 hypothetical protein ROR02_30540 [Pararhodospirillum oryzae]